MAASHGTFTTGTEEGDVRRRNVQTYDKINGSTVYKIEAKDSKKLSKVNPVRQFHSESSFSQLLTFA